jgi:hypothetical protein
MRSMFRGSGGFVRRTAVLAAAAATGVALPAAGLWAGSASAATTPTVTVTGSPNPSWYGEDVTFTAVIGVSEAVGTVTFTYGVTTLCSDVSVTDDDGTYEATCPDITLPGGSDTVTATYSGYSTTYNSNSNTVDQVVRPDHTFLHAGVFFNAQQTLTVWAALYTYGEPLSGPFSGPLSRSYDEPLSGPYGEPLSGESITFTVGDNTLCTATTDDDGIAHCNLDYSKSLLIVRNDGWFEASFAGTDDYDPATAEGFGIVPS